MTKIAILQMTSGIDPEANAAVIVNAAREASAGGAAILFTPEMCGLLDRNRERATPNIVTEEANSILSAASDAARGSGIWIALGSLAVRGESDKWANRSLLIAPDGKIAARYDKMHMFDVELADGESWRESAAYRAGDQVVTAPTPMGRLGLAVCYDIRFPALFEELGQRECDAIAIPAAFTVSTGRDHWHMMVRARAVEASAFVIAAAQVGLHEDGRKTYGHSLVVDPWGKVLLDMGGEESGLGFVECDLERIDEVRRQVPSLANRRVISGVGPNGNAR